MKKKRTSKAVNSNRYETLVAKITCPFQPSKVKKNIPELPVLKYPERGTNDKWVVQTYKPSSSWVEINRLMSRINTVYDFWHHSQAPITRFVAQLDTMGFPEELDHKTNGKVIKLIADYSQELTKLSDMAKKAGKYQKVSTKILRLTNGKIANLKTIAAGLDGNDELVEASLVADQTVAENKKTSVTIKFDALSNSSGAQQTDETAILSDDQSRADRPKHVIKNKT